MANNERIRELNDNLRKTLLGGQVVITASLADRTDLNQILEKVRTFDDFSEDNDPHKEHDFGSIEIGSDTLFWKIDAYSLDMNGASPNSADEKVTQRVLCIMHSSEY